MRFHAAGFDEIEFISYRDDLGSPASCGPRKRREPVFVTWRPIEGILPAPPGLIVGRVTAIEFLPYNHPSM